MVQLANGIEDLDTVLIRHEDVRQYQARYHRSGGVDRLFCPVELHHLITQEGQGYADHHAMFRVPVHNKSKHLYLQLWSVSPHQ